MESLDRAGPQTPPLRVFVGAVLAVIGLAGVAIGGHAVVRGALEPHPAALQLATAGVGAGVVGLLVVSTLLIGPERINWPRVGIGGGLAGGGIGLFVVSVPAGWAGAVGLWALPAGTAYAAGLFLLLGVFFTAALDHSSSVDATATVSVPTGTGQSPGHSEAGKPPAGVAGDGGNDDEELSFLLDDSEEQEDERRP